MISKLNRAEVLALATVAVIGFAAIQLGMASMAGRTPAWDKTVMEKVRDCSERFGAPFTTHLNETIRDISALGGMTVLGMLSVAICGYFLLRRDYSASALLLASWLGGWGSMNGLKYLYRRARPDIVLKLQEATGYSFPSGHTMVATVVYLTLAFILIDRLENRTYFGTLHLLVNGTAHSLDCRPSDLVTLALRFDAPLLVEENLTYHIKFVESDAAEPTAPSERPPAASSGQTDQPPLAAPPAA
jgi:undecaprenyl-diphosphatase